MIKLVFKLAVRYLSQCMRILLFQCTEIIAVSPTFNHCANPMLFPTNNHMPESVNRLKNYSKAYHLHINGVIYAPLVLMSSGLVKAHSKINHGRSFGDPMILLNPS